MRELFGNLFSPPSYRSGTTGYLAPVPRAICIAVNGFVKRNGDAVMGRGCARRACEILTRHGSLAKRVGDHIKAYGNIVHCLGSHNEIASSYEVLIYTLPVKAISEKCERNAANVVSHMKNQFSYGDTVPGWACKARMEMIQASAEELYTLVNMTFGLPNVPSGNVSIILPRLGCGAGELDWQDVKPELDKILDDRFYAITFGTVEPTR